MPFLAAPQSRPVAVGRALKRFQRSTQLRRTVASAVCVQAVIATVGEELGHCPFTAISLPSHCFSQPSHCPFTAYRCCSLTLSLSFPDAHHSTGGDGEEKPALDRALTDIQIEAEVSSLRAVLRRFDKDGDGLLEEDELAAGGHPGGAGAGGGAGAETG